MSKNTPPQVLTLTLLLATLAFGQANPKDVDGWNSVKWSMTAAQAQAAAGPEFPAVKVGDLQLVATLEPAPGSDRIHEVKLKLAATNFSARTEACKTLTDLLIQKYGAPAHRSALQTQPGRPTDTTVTWIFPSTIISLERFESASGDMGYVTILYTATNKKALDVL